MAKYEVKIYYDEIVEETIELEAQDEVEAEELAVAGEGEVTNRRTVSGELLIGSGYARKIGGSV